MVIGLGSTGKPIGVGGVASQFPNMQGIDIMAREEADERRRVAGLEQMEKGSELDLQGFERKMTIRQESEMQRYVDALAGIETDAELTEDQKEDSRRQLKEKMYMLNQGVLQPKKKSPWPTGQDVGQTWQDPMTGATMTRQPDGGVKQLSPGIDKNKAWETAFKNATDPDTGLTDLAKAQQMFALITGSQGGSMSGMGEQPIGPTNIPGGPVRGGIEDPSGAPWITGEAIPAGPTLGELEMRERWKRKGTKQEAPYREMAQKPQPAPGSPAERQQVPIGAAGLPEAPGRTVELGEFAGMAKQPTATKPSPFPSSVSGYQPHHFTIESVGQMKRQSKIKMPEKYVTDMESVLYGFKNAQTNKAKLSYHRKLLRYLEAMRTGAGDLESIFKAKA